MAPEVLSRADARAKGATRYFTGNPCKHGHIAERQVTNGVCIICRTEIEQRWNAANPDKLRLKRRDQARRHRHENPERIRANKKRWAIKNAGKVRENVRRWAASHPERKLAHSKKWSDANREKIARKNRAYKTTNAERLAPINRARVRKWQKDNPDGVRRAAHKRRARKMNAPGSHTAAEIKALLEQQKWECAGCGTSLRQKRHLDHIVALSRGGSNDISNLQWLCPTCNCSKHNKDPLVWARERQAIAKEMRS